MKRAASILIPLILLVTAAGFRIFEPPVIEEIRLKVFDLYQRLKPRTYVDAPVRLADIDEESLKKLGQWPWPRTRIAQLVSRLNELGAAVIVFDMIFPEADRTSPGNVLPLWPEIPAVKTLESQLAELPDHDKILGDAVHNAHVVTGVALVNELNTNRPPVKTEFVYVGRNPAEYLPKFHGAITSLPVIESASPGNGCINTVQEKDGVVRRVPLMFALEESLYPSLVSGAISTYQDQAAFLVRYAGDSGNVPFWQNSGIVSVDSGDYSIPTDNQGRMWLYDSGYVPSRFIPVWKILSGDIPAGAIKGKIIFLGTSAVGLKDLRITPLNPTAAGSEVHVQLVEQILLKKFLTRPDWAVYVEIVYLFVMGLILIFLTQRGALWSAWIGIIAAGASIAFSWYGFTNLHVLIDPLYPAFTLLAIYIASSFIQFLKTESEKRQVRGAFSRYLSPALVEELVRHPEKLKLGGETKNVTLLFSDIRGFTTISEQFNAQELTSFMNRFLTPMTDLILKQKGTIDKYIGDCIMAFWNAPLDDPQHAANACRAALNMRDHLVHWNQTLRAEFEARNRAFTPVDIGIGINTGDCCVGNLGSEQRFDYSVLGDEVNLASRLEGQSKAYGVDIVIGTNTFERLKDFALLELDLLQVKGKTKPVRIFGLLGDETMKNSDFFPKLSEFHEQMLTAYRNQNWTEALHALEECRKLDNPKTRLRTLYSLYANRIHAYQLKPPGPKWEGVTVAIFK